ncbi:hypothetical protein RD792_006634 [Penstemon davidsonii]|uniref:RNase H type-1 domain-containing protein n=1 Tax=Penstemon davidsonii TaxID=160366 RepID=A0ABR0DC75_9LAMI|nr:hypothetical protein RD792_006634 [Penstemon davidsonii]
MDHLFLRCSFAKAVWFNSKWNFRIDPFSFEPVAVLIHRLLDPESNLFSSKTVCFEFLIFVVVSLEHVWRHRNLVTHGKVAPSIPKCIAAIEKRSAEHFRPQSNLCLLRPIAALSAHRLPPKSGSLKVNTDAAFKDGMASIAVVIRNCNGTIVIASTTSYPCLSSLAAEMLSIKVACSLLNDFKLVDVCIKNDCLHATSLILNRQMEPDWDARVLIKDIRKFWDWWPKWKFRFLPRGTNFAAHNLVAWTVVSTYIAMKRPISTEQVDISSDDSSSSDAENAAKRNEHLNGAPPVKLCDEVWLYRKAESYQEHMKLLPIPKGSKTVITCNSWMELGNSMKNIYEQPLHYLTNIHLKRLDQARFGCGDQFVPLDRIIHPVKAEMSVWLIEEVHRLTTSPLQLHNYWAADPMYRSHIDAIYPKLAP